MKKSAIVAGALIVAVIGSLIAVFVIQRCTPAPGEPGSGGESISENIQDMITKTVATEKGVAEENVKICFYTQTTDNNIFAAGAVTRGTAAISIVFLYDNTLRQITQTENEYAPTTNEEFQAFSIVAGRLSPWTGEGIVPCFLTKMDNSYNFKYYDDYLAPLSRWSYGFATMYLDNEAIEWGAHTM